MGNGFRIAAWLGVWHRARQIFTGQIFASYSTTPRTRTTLRREKDFADAALFDRCVCLRRLFEREDAVDGDFEVACGVVLGERAVGGCGGAGLYEFDVDGGRPLRRGRVAQDGG